MSKVTQIKSGGAGGIHCPGRARGSYPSTLMKSPQFLHLQRQVRSTSGSGWGDCGPACVSGMRLGCRSCLYVLVQCRTLMSCTQESQLCQWCVTDCTFSEGMALGRAPLWRARRISVTDKGFLKLTAMIANLYIPWPSMHHV